MKLDILMLLPLRHEPNMRVNPQIEIGTYLANFGHQVTWVLSSEKMAEMQQFQLNNVYMYIIPYIHRFGGSSLLGHALDKILYGFRRMRSILKIASAGKYNLIFVRDGAFDGLLALYIRKRHKIPLVFELSSPFEEEWEGYKIESKKPIVLYYAVAKLGAFIRAYIMKKADLVLPTTQWFEEGLTRRGIPSSKLMPFPNGVDIDSFQGRDGRSVRKKYHLGDSKVMAYIGTLGKARQLGILIRAFARIKKERAKVKLLIVGAGSDKENLESLAGELGIEDAVIFTGEVPQSEVPDFIAAADIGVSPVPPLPFYKLGSPIKMFEYMAMAKPVVANEEIPEQNEVLKQSGGGILVPFTPEAFAEAIIELLDNVNNAQEMGQRGREWVTKYRSYEALARRLEERYFELLKDVAYE